MMTPSPASISPWLRRPSAPVIRARSRKPKAVASQSIARGPSSYAIIGITSGEGGSITSSISVPATSCGFRRAVLAENSAKNFAALPDRDVVGEGRLERRQQVVGPARRALDRRAVAFEDFLRALGAQVLESACLRRLVPRADLHDLQLVRV